MLNADLLDFVCKLAEFFGQTSALLTSPWPVQPTLPFYHCQLMSHNKAKVPDFKIGFQIGRARPEIG